MAMTDKEFAVALIEAKVKARAAFRAYMEQDELGDFPFPAAVIDALAHYTIAVDLNGTRQLDTLLDQYGAGAHLSNLAAMFKAARRRNEPIPLPVTRLVEAIRHSGSEGIMQIDTQTGNLYFLASDGSRRWMR